MKAFFRESIFFVKLYHIFFPHRNIHYENNFAVEKSSSNKFNIYEHNTVRQKSKLILESTFYAHTFLTYI